MKDKYEVVISGMAGKFPESDTIEEFQNNLLNKIDMITYDDRRWKEVTSGPLKDVPRHTGKINGRDEMDMTFFGLHRRLCQVTDPHQRLCLEMTIAALIDAGLNPTDLWGSNTAVVATSVTSETEYECLIDTMNIGISILGHSRSMQANRISYSFNFTGPSLMVDSSWNGSLEGIAYAADLISQGTVRSAVVASCSLLYTAEVAYHYHRMGRLTPKGGTRCFSNDAVGYDRSEGCVVFFLQRKEDALRNYGSVLTMRSQYIGSKPEPISEISTNTFKEYLKKFYEENNIDPNSIGFIEAAGTASKVVDAAELNTLGEILTKNRQNPLLVGSVKSNVGHAEAAAGAISVAKALLISNHGIIHPNLHYNEPNDLVPYLLSGNIKVVTEPTPLKGDIIGVTSFGCTSTFSHLVIKRCNKPKNRKPELNVLPPDGLPRLFIISGRNEEELIEILKRTEQRPIDEEYIALANNVYKKGVKKHLYRGYTVINDKNRVARGTKSFFTGGQKVKPVWFVFTGMGSQWPGMGAQLMKIPIFAKAIHHCHEVLKPKGVDLINIITTPNGEIFNNILHSFVGIAAIQIALVDVLTELGIKPDGIIGHSVGELGCAYADGCFTADQMILAAYARGRASIESELIPGMMAAVGKGYNVMKHQVPDGIEVACHNSADSCTLSGPAKLMEEYIESLKKQSTFAKLVNVANIAYHSKYIRPAAPALLRYLKEVIPNPKPRSSKWISSSVPESDWDKDSAKYCSAEYHTNNLLGSVLFEEAARHIPSDAVIIEIAPHGLLQAILKRSFPSAVHVPLTNRTESQGLIFLMNSLGKLYLEGIDMDLENLYPSIDYPVSRGTPSLDDLVVWNHSENWRINLECNIEDFDAGCNSYVIKSRSMKIDTTQKEIKYLGDYKVYGCPVIPLSWYLNLVIQDYQKLHKLDHQIIMVQNIHLRKYQKLVKEVELYLSLGKGSGYWEVSQNSNEVASGEILTLISGFKTLQLTALGTSLSDEEVYNYFSHMGHNIGPSFRVFKSVTLSTTEVSAIVSWNGNLTVFLDAVLKLPSLLNTGENKLHMVSEIKQLVIDFSKFKKDEPKEIQAYYHAKSGKLVCDGLQILYPNTSEPTVLPNTGKTISCQELMFMPYDSPCTNDIRKLLEFCMIIVYQKIDDSFGSENKLSVIEVKEKVDLYNELHEIVKWKNDVKIQIKIAATDSSLDGYSVNSNSEFCFIVTESDKVENSLSVLQKSRGGFLLFVKDHPTHLPSCLSVIFTTQIGEKRFTLCTLKKKLFENLKYVSLACDDWREQLKSQLNTNGNEITYLAGAIPSLTGINIITEECKKLPNSHMLRYIFIDSEVNEFQPIKFREQLEKDLKINILKNGKWGTCMMQPKDIVPDKKTSIKTHYEFSDIRIEGDIQPKALGLNFNDVTNNRNKLEVYEFSGIVKNKSVCGIGRLTEATRIIQPDPSYVWKKPEGWSHESVASVLMPYAMAFHIMNTKFNYCSKKFDRILIHHGVLPLSQAVINVALSIGATIFTTYENEDEKNLIMKLFPEIPENNILNYKSNFETVILNRTNAEGVRIVVNTLQGRKFIKPSMECLGIESIYFQISQQVCEEQDKMGMFVFLKLACIIGLSPSLMLSLEQPEKNYLQRAIEEGFEKGIIKPFSTVTISSSVTNIGAENIISENSILDKKAVVSMEYKVSSIEGSRFLCDQKAVYAILGTGQGFWLDLVEWIAKRGAQSVHIFTNENTLNGVGSKKLHDLLCKNPNLKCKLTPESVLNDVKTAQVYIEEINKTGRLDTIFIIGKENEQMTEVICQISKERVVVVSENADLFCEERINNGLPTLAVSLPNHLLTSYEMLPRLDLLLCNDQQIVFIKEESINNNIDVDTERMAYLSHLPGTIQEVLAFGKGPEKACWKERKSNSPAYKYCPELPPVFVLPPLRPGKMDSIIKSLFHPTFVAAMPKKIQDFDQIGYELFKDLERFTSGVFTIICSDWSWPIGIILGKLLEKNGKEVSLIFFESSITWESETTYKQVINEIKKDSSFDTLASQEKERQIMKVQKSIQKLKHLLNLFGSKLPPKSPKIKGICHYIRHNEMFKNEWVAKLQEYCEQTINVYTSGESDYLSMLNNKDVIQHINSCILFEYKDAARRIEKMYMKESIYNNPRLSYLSFMQSFQLNRCTGDKNICVL